jgi:plastocyanin
MLRPAAGRSVAIVIGFLAAIAAGCGDDGGGSSSPTPAGGCRVAAGGTVTIVADKLAWDTDCLELPPDDAVMISVDNRDTGVNHNLRVEDLPGGDVATKLETGPVVQELEVSAPAGTYRFVCDIHPNMVGELVVADP